MPFEQTFNDWTDAPQGYIWTVDPDVDEDISEIDPTATTLKIEPGQDRPTRIPSFDGFNTGNLQTLDISDMDVTEMPRIPASVRYLTFTETNLTNLNQVNVDWSQIRVLELHSNRGLDGSVLIVPEGVETLLIRHNRFDIIRLPSTMRRFCCDNVSVKQLTGHVSTTCNILFGYNCTFPKYWMGYSITRRELEREMDQLDDPEDGEAEEHLQVRAKCDAKLAHHIHYVNTAENAKIYADLAEIKHRIRNPSSHSENPMVAALFLGSNYLRRAAEFINEETIVV
jgi:hypothetical protein